MTDRRTGQCLCGAVTFSATIPKPEIQACHCEQCQRWTGGGPLYSIRISDLELDGEAAFTQYRASEWGERVFCGTCGATLFWRMQGETPRFIAPGLLDDQSGLGVTEEIFCDRRAVWLPAHPAAAQSTEAEEQAKLKAFLEGDAT